MYIAHETGMPYFTGSLFLGCWHRRGASVGKRSVVGAGWPNYWHGRQLIILSTCSSESNLWLVECLGIIPVSRPELKGDCSGWYSLTPLWVRCQNRPKWFIIQCIGKNFSIVISDFSFNSSMRTMLLSLRFVSWSGPVSIECHEKGWNDHLGRLHRGLYARL